MDPLEEVERMEGEDADAPVDGASKDAWDLEDDEDEILVLLHKDIVDIVFGDGEAGQAGAHGGSALGRRENLPRDFDATLKRLQNHYLGINGSPLYTEEMLEGRYGMPRAMFDRIFERMKGRPEFVQKTMLSVGRKPAESELQ